jgi:cell division cycle protein 37
MISKKPDPSNASAASAAEPSSKTTSTGKGKTIETIHDPSNTDYAPETSEEEEEADYITYEPAEKFAHLKDFSSSSSFLSQYPALACQKYSDEILAEAFRLEMKGEKEVARNCVRQSLILQYCGLLGKDGISMFFKR